MKLIWKHNKYPVLFFFILMLAVGTVLLMHDKTALHMSINTYHAPVWDWFFKHITHLGDGFFIVILAVILAFFSFRSSLVVLVAYLSSGLVVQIMKRLIFTDCKRPAALLGEDALYLIEGVKMVHYKAFPSGHATSAIALGFCLVFLTRSQAGKMIFLLLSMVVAFSRVYISQHFLEDIYMGAIIGFLFSLLTYYIVQKNDRSWFNQSLLRVWKKS